MDENNITKDIKRGIEWKFSWFKKQPSLEQHCMKISYRIGIILSLFVILGWDGSVESQLNNLKKSNQDFDFEIIY